MKAYDMHLTDVAKRFKIPYSTVQKWYYDVAEPPQYVLNMINTIILMAIDMADTSHKLEKASDLLHDDRIEEAIEIIDNI
jgi:hypothetical protein